MNAKKTGNDAWVETLLKANPLEVADEEFSQDIMIRIKRYERRRFLVLAPFFITGFALALFFFPFELIEGVSGSVSASYENLVPYLVPLGAVVVMFMFSWFSEEVA